MLHSSDRQFCRVALEHSLEVQLLHFALQATWKTGIHGGTTGKNDVLVKLRPGVDVCRLDRVEEKLGDPNAFHVYQVRLEESLRCLETFAPNFYNASVRQLEKKQSSKMHCSHSGKDRIFYFGFWQNFIAISAASKQVRMLSK